MDAGSLQDIVDVGGCADEAVVASVALRCLHGLAFLHDRKQIHRDVKPANLLINHLGQASERQRCPLLSFVLAVLRMGTDGETYCSTPLRSGRLKCPTLAWRVRWQRRMGPALRPSWGHTPTCRPSASQASPTRTIRMVGAGATARTFLHHIRHHHYHYHACSTTAYATTTTTHALYHHMRRTPTT